MKNYFIPHKGNEFEPYVFKPKNIFLIFVLGILVASASYIGMIAIRNISLLASIQSAFLVDLANEDRIDQQVSTLTVNPILVEVAQRKANDMAAKGYFAHTSPEGKTPWFWFQDVGYTYVYAGENLAVNFTESIDVHNAWIASPTHKKNILDQRFTEIGIATAEGVYRGRKATFVVQMFGKPRPSLLSSISKQTTVHTLPITTLESNMPPSSSLETTQIFGVQDEETSFTLETNVFERILVSPISSVRIILLSIISILFVVITIRIMVEFKKHHIMQVCLLLLVALGLLLVIFIQKKMFFAPQLTYEEDQIMSEL